MWNNSRESGKLTTNQVEGFNNRMKKFSQVGHLNIKLAVKQMIIHNGDMEDKFDNGLLNQILMSQEESWCCQSCILIITTIIIQLKNLYHSFLHKHFASYWSIALIIKLLKLVLVVVLSYVPLEITPESLYWV
jgi:hypothetical protein